ncbi:hypothetical protein DIPPA_30464, partial [Diplonema papillatum]
MTQAKTFGVGTAAGFLGSLIGLGGGFVAVPLLTGTLKLTQHQAHGTSLAAVTATGTFGALSYGSVGSVDVTAAMAIACGVCLFLVRTILRAALQCIVQLNMQGQTV